MMFYSTLSILLLHLIQNSSCSFADEPTQKIKATVKQSQWHVIREKVFIDNLDVYKKRFFPNEIEVTAVVTAIGEQYLEMQQIPFDVLDIDLNLSAEVDANDSLGVPGIINGSLTFQRALSFKELLYYLKAISQNSTKTRNISVIDIGMTDQGEQIKMIKIEHPDTEKIAVINGGIYGRESITVMTALYFIEQLIMADPDNPVNKINWYIIPCLNPDDYIYSHSKFRFHKSNRTNPGIQAFSELKSRALVTTLQAYADKIITYIALHSYGCNILYPWTYKREPCEDANELIKAANFAIASMNGKHHRTNCKFEVHHAGAAPGPADSIDYAKAALNIKYSYTIELQEGGKSGFYPTKDELERFLKQNYDGIKSLCGYIAKKENKMALQHRVPAPLLEDYRSGDRNYYVTFWFYGNIPLLWMV